MADQKDQNPTAGGSYVRRGDGSLEQAAATAPAQPRVETEPVTPAHEEQAAAEPPAATRAIESEEE